MPTSLLVRAGDPSSSPSRPRTRDTPQVDINGANCFKEPTQGAFYSEMKAALDMLDQSQKQEIRSVKTVQEDVKSMLGSTQRQFAEFQAVLQQQAKMTAAILLHVQNGRTCDKLVTVAANGSASPNLKSQPGQDQQTTPFKEVTPRSGVSLHSSQQESNGDKQKQEKRDSGGHTDAPRSTARKSVLQETYVDGDEEDPKFKKKGGLFGDMGTDRDTLDKVEYDVCNFYHQTGYCQRIARSETFQSITLSVIGLNTVYIGVDADNNNATNLADADIGFQVCEHLFACFFTFEWVVRLCAFEYKRNCLKDNWFKFDTCLVWLMIGETWIMTILGGVDLGIPLGFIKMLRLLRLARMARLMRAFPELVAMMKGVKAASRAVGSALLMLVFNVYIFAIIMHMIYGGTAMERGLVIVMWDLLMDGTFVNGIGPYTRNLIDLEMHFGIAIFMVFVLLSAMTVMNMLIGVLCQVVSAVAAVEQENNAIQLVKTTLLVMLKTLDDNGNGLISKDELQQMVEHPEALEVLHSLDLDPKDLVEHLDMHYELEASDDPQLHINKIIDVILLMRGERPPNMKDLVNEQNFNRWKISKMLKDHPR